MGDSVSQDSPGLSKRHLNDPEQSVLDGELLYHG